MGNLRNNNDNDNNNSFLGGLSERLMNIFAKKSGDAEETDTKNNRCTQLSRLITKENMLVLLLSGILIYVILLPVEDDKNDRSWNKSAVTDRQASADSGMSQNSNQNTKKALEKELADFLTGVAGVGRVEVLLYCKENKTDDIFSEGEMTTEIEGVIISAEGASNEQVRLQIMKMVMALYGLEANKVEVVPMGL